MESEKDVQVQDALQEDASKSKLQSKPRPSVQELYAHSSDPTTVRELYGSIGMPSDSGRTLLFRKLDVWAEDILLLWTVALFGMQNIRRFDFEGMQAREGRIYFSDKEYPRCKDEVVRHPSDAQRQYDRTDATMDGNESGIRDSGQSGQATDVRRSCCPLPRPRGGLFRPLSNLPQK
jgi:hypothetical protein